MRCANPGQVSAGAASFTVEHHQNSCLTFPGTSDVCMVGNCGSGRSQRGQDSGVGEQQADAQTNDRFMSYLPHLLDTSIT
eukprot:353182-Chlamydomonas_euryale.AAC.24